ncbi:ABC transporter ATP-binding protein [Paenibacillus macquariensis]|uniref:Iron complex transport system ATP-binding protein n=1 Tax=Paenibacillus macquariensis TaxID=948756 RepID=A0ABY1K4E6_9BACL|nr:ABC transporter ATP-binding protein [Paenibacillus macquariensis]MEC0088991.1 ABC transporter ATP-binding protein [Paenibacillus macquariensis]OAB31869.1 iron ABC transporter ATP-binding protein [Paenibacillus macquariensis subsp. macquariensis]SIR24079.1 iron complex transport system ATP-binding protein [Paenibacillus macquariensis]
MTALNVDRIATGYSNKLIINDLSVSIPENKITTIIGPNGCGKSTLLKAISRVLKTKSGAVYLDGRAIHQLETREVAKRMAILPQTASAPEGLTVFELISYGRFPHQKGFGTLKKEDYKFIYWALDVTGLNEFKDRPIEALSGGQRQRVWIAMALAQGTEILILDEPTTYLDLAHQLDILLLLQRLKVEEGRTIVMVLHDLNHASRFSDYMIAMKDGTLIIEGTPEEVMTCPNLENVFNIDASMATCPFSNNPICLSYQLFQKNR